MSTRPFTIKKITGASPGDGVEAFKDAIRDRKLIPFLGAAVSANNLNDSPEYATIIDSIHLELDELRNVLATLDGKKQSLRFVADFINRYMAIRVPDGYCQGTGMAALSVAGGRALPSSAQMSHVDVRVLRVALVQLIVALTVLFKKRLTEESANASTGAGAQRSSAFFFSSKDLAVSLPDATALNASSTHAKKVLVQLQKVRNFNFTPGPLGGAKTIFEGMCRELALRYSDKTGMKTAQDEKLSHLDIGHLTWLSDLLWLTFFIWLPLYPTSHELAVELSLVAQGKKKTSGIDLLRTAECVQDPQALSDYLGERFLRFNPDGENRPSKALIMEPHWRTAAMAIYQSLPRESDTESANPVIFTTNFDNGLELALENMIRMNLERKEESSKLVSTYRVVFPILAAVPSNSSEKYFYLWWVARDWSISGAKDEPIITYKWLDDTVEQSGGSNRTSFSFPKRSTVPEAYMKDGESVAANMAATDIYSTLNERISGPVIVKLHGGPLHDLPPSCQTANVGPHRDPRPYRHYIVASEHQYLEAIVREHSSFPKWASDLLSGSQHVSFVGYSVNDWNIRVQLAKDLGKHALEIRQPKESAGSASTSPEALVASRTQSRRSILVKSIDQPSKALLERLGVWSEEVSLDKFTNRLYHDFNDLRSVDPKEL